MRTTLRHNLNWKTTTFFTQERLEGGAVSAPRAMYLINVILTIRCGTYEMHRPDEIM